MTRKILCLVTMMLLAGVATARAETLIDSDFDTRSAGWTLGGADNLTLADTGGPTIVLADTTPSASLWAYNTTALPLLLTIDLDFRITHATATDPFVIGFHVWGTMDDPMAMPTGPLQEHRGYFLAFTGGDYPTMQVQRRRGPEDFAVVDQVPLAVADDQVHHLRITDCGCGNLNIFIDDMNGSLLYVPDKYNYVGGIGSRLGVGTPGEAAGWIDNVFVDGEAVVPEPATLLLLLAGAVTRIRRR